MLVELAKIYPNFDSTAHRFIREQGSKMADFDRTWCGLCKNIFKNIRTAHRFITKQVSIMGVIH